MFTANGKRRTNIFVLPKMEETRLIAEGLVGAVVRSLPSNPKVPGSIPGSAETGIFGDLLSR